ncbi:MAG: thiol:disulfide interchange protein DsbG [Pseudomonadaceae bacterium]|nr:MAG: thiol:disulfide interchange protein DsbG [Pseudomonadaceae bacterium]
MQTRTGKLAYGLALAGGLWSMPALVSAEDWPAAVRAIEQHGGEIIGEFDAPEGLRGFAASFSPGQSVGVYLTPDKAHVIVGTLLDADGRDLSSAAIDQITLGPQTEKIWQQLADSNWVQDGEADAPQIVYMFNDPNCPFCNRFWQQARPWVESGEAQIRHVMVGMLRADSAARAASILAADDPAAALLAHEQGNKSAAMQTIPASVQAQLDTNLSLMRELGVQATPSSFALDADGLIQQHQGVPAPDIMRRLMAP